MSNNKNDRDKVVEAADKHTEFLGAKARINKKEFFEELGIDFTSLVDALEEIEEGEASKQ